MLTGENGILTQAQNAKKGTEQAGDIEKIRLAISEAQIGESGYQELNFQSFQKALNSQFGENKAIVSLEEDGTYTVSCFDSLKDYAVSGNEIKETIDWNEKMANAVVPEEQTNKNVVGIGTDGDTVNMDLWKYTPDEETGGYNLNSEDVISNEKDIAGYRGIVKEDGTIEGTVPQYIKENNGDWTPVTSLYNTFNGNDETKNRELTKLTTAPKIPSTVKSMKVTFKYCEGLTNIICIPGNVKQFRWTLSNCTVLEKMPEIGYGVEDMTGAFSGCSKLKKLAVLPDTVKDLSCTFASCSVLKEIPNIPDDVNNMYQTFFSCRELENVDITIPKNVTNIQQTFFDCTKLEGKITINCNPKNYENFLQWTTKPITLTGKSNMLNQIAEGRSNVTVIQEKE